MLLKFEMQLESLDSLDFFPLKIGKNKKQEAQRIINEAIEQYIHKENDCTYSFN